MTPQEYFQFHSLNEEYIKKNFAVTWDENKITIPIYGEDKKLLYCKYRHLTGETKFTFDKGGHPALFPIYKILELDSVVLCEGEPDCMRLWQEGIPAVTATSGVKTFNSSLASKLKGKLVYICLDTDSAGQDEVEKYAKVLAEAGAKPLIVRLPSMFKDVSVFFTEGGTKAAFQRFLDEAITYEEYREQQMKEIFPIIKNDEFLKMDLPENPWLIKNIIRSRGFFVISGLGGTGKSLLALDMIKSITKGIPWLDKFECQSKCNVLILDKENDKADLQYNMVNMGVNSPNIYHVMLTSGYKTVEQDETLTKESVYLRDFIISKNINVVMIDSLIDIYQGSENDAVHAAKNFDFLRQIFPNILVMLLHHEGKPGDKDTKKTPGNRMRGSTNVFNELSSQIAVSVPDITHPTNIVIEHGKVRRGQKIKAFEVEMVVKDDVFHPGETKVTGFKYIKEMIFTEMAKDQAKIEILDVLQNENDWVKGTELKDILRTKGIGKTAVESALKEMADDELSIEMEKRGHANFYKICVTGTYKSVDNFIKNLKDN